MGFREDLARRIERKRAEITDLESQAKTAKTYLQALEDMYKMAARDPSGNATSPPLPRAERSATSPSFRVGSLTQGVYDALKAAGRPLHVSALLEAVGREVTRKEKSAVSGTLAAYVRKGDVFTRPGPNTFGLTEFGGAAVNEAPVPPPGFGKL